MTMWLIIFWAAAAFFGVSVFYLGTRVLNFFDPSLVAKWGFWQQFLICSGVVIGFMGIITFFINFINAAVCALYFAIIWFVSESVFWFAQKFFHLTFSHYYAGWTAVLIAVLSLGIGWILAHHVQPAYYTLTTQKKLSDLRIVMFADSHLGTTFNGSGFEKHVKAMQAENPDIVFIIGDYVDDDTKKDDMIKACELLGKMKTKYGIYFVFGNHDKGYYGSKYRNFNVQDLIQELQKNGITVLRDENVLIDNSFYVIGRKDFSEVQEKRGGRKSTKDLTDNLDKNKYMIILDHQPTDFKNQTKENIDLVLCGHTHGGQLWPFNQVGKWIGANDLVYGHEKRNNTDFVVTSGISDWAIKFKTGTQSEYVVIDVKGK